MKGDMFSGSSGATAPMGVQFLVSWSEMLDARSASTTPKRRARLFASCGWRDVEVALSLNAPYAGSKQFAFMAFFSFSALDVQVVVNPVVSPAQVARSAPVFRV